MTKTQLRKRWKSDEFVSSLTIPRDRMPTEAEAQDLDLRGVPKLANGEPLWYFQLHAISSHGIDLSYGDGCLVITDSTVTGMKCIEFRFDRATRFTGSQFDGCDFTSARLRQTSYSCVFRDCVFDMSTFAGGFNEYGFDRCAFETCSFQRIRWERTYFKWCTFSGCDFTQAQILDSIGVDFRHRHCAGLSATVFGGESDIVLNEWG